MIKNELNFNLYYKEAIDINKPIKVASLEEYNHNINKLDFINLFSFQGNIDNYVVGNLYIHEITKEIYLFGVLPNENNALLGVGFYRFKDITTFKNLITIKNYPLDKNQMNNLILDRFIHFKHMKEKNLLLLGNLIVHLGSCIYHLNQHDRYKEYEDESLVLVKMEDFSYNYYKFNEIKIQDIISKNIYYSSNLSYKYTLENRYFSILLGIQVTKKNKSKEYLEVYNRSIYELRSFKKESVPSFAHLFMIDFDKGEPVLKFDNVNTSHTVFNNEQYKIIQQNIDYNYEIIFEKNVEEYDDKLFKFI